MKIGVDRSVLHIINAADVLQKQLRIANFDKDIYLQSISSKYEVGSA